MLIRPATTPVAGLGYGFLFGLAFSVPLLPWTSDFVGVRPWLILATICAVYPALFGLLASGADLYRPDLRQSHRGNLY